jgi:Winged helix DNA-binding domain
MSERVLTQRELNRALLARQVLLARGRMPVTRALERIGGLQAQWPPAPYIALRARLEGFERRQLETALRRYAAVKATLMRQTLHIVSGDDYPHFVAAMRRPRHELMLKQLPPEYQIDNLPETAGRIAAPAAERPRTRKELCELAAGYVNLYEGVLRWQAWSAVQAHARLVHEPESGYWRTTGSSRLTVWPYQADVDPDDGLDRLASRYLAAFGPATAADLASWAGLRGPHIAPALDRLPLRRFRDERGRMLLDLPRGALPGRDVPAPPRFLAKWDSPLLAYEPTRRGRILPEPYRKAVIQKNGDTLQTVLVEGFVAATWRVERARRGAALVVEPFEGLPKAALAELEAEAMRTLVFVEPDAPSHAVRIG